MKAGDADTLSGVTYSAISTEMTAKIAAHNADPDHEHLTNAQKADLTGGGDTSLHYHASDRNLANATGILDASHLDSSQLQMRVTGTCGSGSSIRTVNPDGSVVCEPDDVNDGVSNPSGSYPSMSVGYANSAGSANNASSVNGLQFNGFRACYAVGQRSDEGRDATMVWPSNWSTGACGTMACGAGWHHWHVNEFYSNGTWREISSGDCY